MTAPHKHQPLRRCVACRRARTKAHLIRFYRDSHGNWQQDPNKKSGGRGAWVCNDSVDCLQIKTLGRFFRAQAQRVHAELTINTSEAQNTTSKNGGLNV